MKIAILGFGSQGVSSLEYWAADDHEITICDENTDQTVSQGIKSQLGPNYLENLDEFDLIVRSPSIHPRDITAANPDTEDILNKVTTNTNEFLQVVPTKNIIGVTGTKGKGTTSTLIAKILESAGFQVHLGGNIGTPPLEMLKNNIKSDEWVVLELANFQLIDIKSSPPIAVCLMVEPEHLDWHSNLNEYVESKQQLFRWQTAQDRAVFYAKNDLSRQITSVSQATKVPYYDQPGAIIENGSVTIEDNRICEVSDIKLLGEHNWQNVCAAVTAGWQVTQNVEAIRSAIKHFSGMPFRLELIREVNGVKYYNDSFGTTPETAIVAIKAFKEPKVIILGGSDKGSNYKVLAQTVVSENVKHVVAIGETKEKILDEIDKLSDLRQVPRTILNGSIKMDEIIDAAKKVAEPGDVVLLSTACASFDLFKDYKDRGEQFNQVVRLLS